MKTPFTPVVVVLSLLLLAGSVQAQSEGSYVTDAELTDFTNTKAKSFDDLVGRAVLIEFFAYW